jgi:hypothetical protein
VTELPAKNTAGSHSFYWLTPEETLYLLIDQTWTAIAGRRVTGQTGRSAYEIAQDQGYPGSIDEWLLGLRGTDGLDGEDGKSAYDLALTGGFIGTLPEWLASLKGGSGDKGDPGKQGEQGENGSDGKSAYELAVAAGYPGREPDWLASLCGATGASAYDIARLHGFTGTESGWLTSLNGAAGVSAYEHALSQGFTGTEADWLASLKGEQGKQGEKGEQGHGIIVLDYYDSYAELLTAHPTGSPGDFYGAAGDLYLWAQGQWKNLGRLIGAIAFEFELLMEQAGIEGASLEDFFRELVNEALSEMDFSSLVQTEVETWLTTHFSSHVSPLVTNWLNQNIVSVLDPRVTTAVANQLPVQLASHLSGYHEWLPV